MPVRQITTRLALDGERQFKNAVAGVNSSLREPRAGSEIQQLFFLGVEFLLGKCPAIQEILVLAYFVNRRNRWSGRGEGRRIYGAGSCILKKLEYPLR